MADWKPRVGSLGKRRARAAEAAPILATLYPGVGISLEYANPLQLVVATILSAQCTDERVNRVTPGLFARYPTARDYAEADREELERLIHSTGFFRNKARNIQRMGAHLASVHDGEVPDTMDKLLELPGVARKTANVVLSNAFGKAEGVVVDTHVKRLARRLGLTGETNPVKVERDLIDVLPREQWIPFAWRLILHGRARCTARRPDCANCELAHLCPSAGRLG
ncbi:MAG: endonuclease III [Gemmatimonadota bacterium]